MPSTKGYLEFILGQLAELEDIAVRAMMGEYILYYHGRIVGGMTRTVFCCCICSVDLRLPHRLIVDQRDL